jgi:DNA-directed RNA polymerase subunit RPC12/RpoP
VAEDSTQPADAAKETHGTDFRCQNCGALLVWDPDQDALGCDHCGAKVPVPRAEVAIVERPLSEAGTAARGLGLETRALRCNTCGATVALDRSATADVCVFCGSSNVLPQEANRNALRPESLIPLDVGRALVEKNFRAWMSGLWFRPDALRKVERFDAVGVYVPYWTFDARVHSDWSADAGHYYYVTEMVPTMVNGRLTMRSQQVRKIRWVPAWGQRDDVYDDLLVHASRGLSEKLLAELGGFDTKALVPYRPEYLAGWRAEEYQVDLDSAWGLARERIVATQEQRCGGDVPGDTYRNLRVRNQLDDVRWKHVLLPMWSLTYRFQGKTYAVLIHGQNGRVHGDAPLSWVKILLLIFGVLALVGVIALVAALAGN